MKTLTRRYLQHLLPGLILGVLALLAWQAYEGLRPVINQVPVVYPGASLVIYGRHFGSQQGSGSVTYHSGSLNQALNVISWNDTRIKAAVPAGARSGDIVVDQKYFTGFLASSPYAFTVSNQGLPSKPYGYRVPVQPASPWPTFRRDESNSGASPIPAVYQGDQPWAFKTGKGIFSTPVIDDQGTIYVGSADHNFYAIRPDGSQAWVYQTGGIIDSAAALEPGTVTFISGDGAMYQFRTGEAAGNAADRLIWRYQAKRQANSFNNWFEGNVAVGPDGTLYAGNTNFNYYAINPDGSEKWIFPTGSNNWSMAAFGPDGTIYWGSLDTYIHAVSPDGQERWRDMTLGFIAASAAVGSDGTVYMGSFDSNLYAIDPRQGKVLWKFPTNDHIYASAALGANAQGITGAIYFGSADGNLYAVDTRGKLLWKYDTGDPIRSSPALGKTPDGQDVIYFGCGNGRLYALSAKDGSLRWAFDTTPPDPELRDRNDLNGSPALGKTGIYIGGEHGYLDYVPYDYCLHAANDSRCSTPGKAMANQLPDNYTGLYYVTPGGTTETTFPASLPPATLITLRLVVRQNGQTANAWVCNNPLGCPKEALQVSAQPDFPRVVEHSADGRYIYIRPTAFLTPGAQYTLVVTGQTYSGGTRLGNLTLGGRVSGSFANTFTFSVDQTAGSSLPLSVSASQTSALEWTRLAAPLPPMLPSLNQIGFDYIDWILGAVDITPPDASGQGRFILWAIGGKRDAQGQLIADPSSDFTFPLSGQYQNDAFILANQNFKMAITGIGIPFNLFQMRGELGANGVVKPGASLYADTQALSIPKFGPYLVMAGLANNVYQKLLVSGTYITRPYPANGPANKAPEGVSIQSLDYKAPAASEDGYVLARLTVQPGTSYPASAHQGGILLVDSQSLQAVSLAYHDNLSSQADSKGNLESIKLTLPKGLSLPSQMKVYVMLDVFPFYQEILK